MALPTVKTSNTKATVLILFVLVVQVQVQVLPPVRVAVAPPISVEGGTFPISIQQQIICTHHNHRSQHRTEVATSSGIG